MRLLTLEYRANSSTWQGGSLTWRLTPGGRSALGRGCERSVQPQQRLHLVSREVRPPSQRVHQLGRGALGSPRACRLAALHRHALAPSALLLSLLLLLLRGPTRPTTLVSTCMTASNAFRHRNDRFFLQLYGPKMYALKFAANTFPFPCIIIIPCIMYDGKKKTYT